MLAIIWIATSGYGAASSTQIKKQMLSHLEFIRGVFEVKYGPTEWKKKHFNWDLNKECENAKTRVQKLRDPNLKDYQCILKDLFNSTQDYHVSIRFFSTEEARLPFLVKGSQGRYFISHIDREFLPIECRDLKIGDEVLQFDKKAVHTAIQELRHRELGNRDLETDQAMAELLLTNREGVSGHIVPQGNVSLLVKKKEGGEKKEYAFSWNYIPEKIRDFSQLGSPKSEVAPYANLIVKQQLKTSLKESGFFDKLLICPCFEKESFALTTNPHVIGSRSSYIPALGRKIWKTDKDHIFDAYIFETPARERIGYIRIPHYLGDEVELDEFSQIIGLFEEHTEALVIDQINNPGGSLFYMYALLSMLAENPMPSPKHHIALTQEDINTAVTWLPVLEAVQDDESARQWVGESFDGYPINFHFVKLMRDFFRFIIDEWSEGNLYTRSTYLFGVDEVMPNPEVRYSKPILVLTNNLCYSCADFFPAMIQDGKRGLILGSRTAGAGGYVYKTRFSNHMGIRDFYLTGSLAERIDKRPVENLGVTPDIPYMISVKDLQENYGEYVRAIQHAVRSMLDKKSKGE